MPSTTSTHVNLPAWGKGFVRHPTDSDRQSDSGKTRVDDFAISCTNLLFTLQCLNGKVCEQNKIREEERITVSPTWAGLCVGEKNSLSFAVCSRCSSAAPGGFPSPYLLG